MAIDKVIYIMHFCRRLSIPCNYQLQMILYQFRNTMCLCYYILNKNRTEYFPCVKLVISLCIFVHNRRRFCGIFPSFISIKSNGLINLACRFYRFLRMKVLCRNRRTVQMIRGQVKQIYYLH